MYGPIEVIGNTNYTGPSTPGPGPPGPGPGPPGPGAPGTAGAASTLTKGPTGWFDTTTPTGTGSVKASKVSESIP